MTLLEKSFLTLKSKVNIIHKSYNREKNPGDTLSIAIDAPYISFSIFDSINKKNLVLQDFKIEKLSDTGEFAERMTGFFRKNEFLKLNYAAVKASVNSTTSTLVPDSYFSFESAKNLLQIGHDIEGEVMFDSISLIKAKNIYTVPKGILNGLNELFPEITVKHSSTVLINNCLELLAEKTGTTLIINVEPDHFEIVIIEKSELLFYNTFKNETSEDFLYFIMYSIQQHALNAEHINTVLVGQVEKNSLLHNTLAKYIRNISFAQRSLEYNDALTFANVESHFYFNLLSGKF